MVAIWKLLEISVPTTFIAQGLEQIWLLGAVIWKSLEIYVHMAFIALGLEQIWLQ